MIAGSLSKLSLFPSECPVKARIFSSSTLFSIPHTLRFWNLNLEYYVLELELSNTELNNYLCCVKHAARTHISCNSIFVFSATNLVKPLLVIGGDPYEFTVLINTVGSILYYMYIGIRIFNFMLPIDFAPASMAILFTLFKYVNQVHL